MKLLKSVFFFIYFLIFLIVMFLLSFPLMVFGQAGKRIFRRLVKSLTRALMIFLGIRLTADPWPEIAKGERIMFVANRPSLVSILFLYSRTPVDTGFASGATALKLPIFGWLIKMAGGIDAKKLSLYKYSSPLLIMPPNMWLSNGEVGDFSPRLKEYANKAGAGIVPVALAGSGPRLKLAVGKKGEDLQLFYDRCFPRASRMIDSIPRMQVFPR